MSYELTFDGLSYDNGYGEMCTELQIDIEPIITNISFDHAFGTYIDKDINIRITCAQLFFTGNNGVELGYKALDPKDIPELKELLKLVSFRDIRDSFLHIYGEELFSGVS